MINVEKCAKILKQLDLDKKTICKIRDELYLIAEVFVEEYLRKNRNPREIIE